MHLKLYSLSMLPAEFVFGSNILAVEPLNLVYYLAILTLTFGLAQVIAGRRTSWLAALTIGLWPSLLLHTTQFLRDPLLLTAFLALILILVLLLKENLNWRYAIGAAMAGAGSIYLVLRVRPAISPVITGIVVLSAALLLVKIAYLRKVFVLNLLVITVLTLVPLWKPKPEASPGGPTRPPGPRVSGFIWGPIAEARYNFIADGRHVSGSMIDSDVIFNSATDVVRYIPRALEIGCLAPFPSMWFQAGQNVGLLGRLLSGSEMMLTYLLEIFAGIFLWQNRKHFSSWLLFLTIMIGMLAIGFVVANVGTLYRMRYPFWVLVVIMGAAGFVELWFGKRRQREVEVPFIEADVEGARASAS
jgi:hypothetical protein